MRILLSSMAILLAMTSLAQDSAVYSQVEIEAAFPGGRSAWSMYLKKNLEYPDEARVHAIEGTVVVQFIVNERTGKLSDIHAISGPHTSTAGAAHTSTAGAPDERETEMDGGLREEAVRLIKHSGVWTPAILNGRQVRAYKKVPIVFKLADS